MRSRVQIVLHLWSDQDRVQVCAEPAEVIGCVAWRGAIVVGVIGQNLTHPQTLLQRVRLPAESRQRDNNAKSDVPPPIALTS